MLLYFEYIVHKIMYYVVSLVPQTKTCADPISTLRLRISRVALSQLTSLFNI